LEHVCILDHYIPGYLKKINTKWVQLLSITMKIKLVENLFEPARTVVN